MSATVVYPQRRQSAWEMFPRAMAAMMGPIVQMNEYRRLREDQQNQLQDATEIAKMLQGIDWSNQEAANKTVQELFGGLKSPESRKLALKVLMETRPQEVYSYQRGPEGEYSLQKQGTVPRGAIVQHGAEAKEPTTIMDAQGNIKGQVSGTVKMLPQEQRYGVYNAQTGQYDALPPGMKPYAPYVEQTEEGGYRPPGVRGPKAQKTEDKFKGSQLFETPEGGYHYMAPEQMSQGVPPGYRKAGTRDDYSKWATQQALKDYEMNAPAGQQDAKAKTDWIENRKNELTTLADPHKRVLMEQYREKAQQYANDPSLPAEEKQRRMQWLEQKRRQLGLPRL